MEVNELRCGNKLIHDGKIISIDVIDRTHPHPIGYQKENETYFMGKLSIFEPIPLTPEILEAAGFECETVEAEFKISGFNIEKTAEKRYIKLGLNKPKYLHQLQNLYYSLTFKELEINLIH